jgi:hypothetical protein
MIILKSSLIIISIITVTSVNYAACKYANAGTCFLFVVVIFLLRSLLTPSRGIV